VNARTSQRVYGAVNLLLGILHFIVGFAEPVSRGTTHMSESYYFLVIAALFFGVATGFLLGSRWTVILTSVPLLLLGVMFAFLIAGGGWIWGPPRIAQTYAFILASLLIAAFEVAGIISIIRLTTKPGSDTPSTGS
jgi:NADH:ubiquinone oxidoreductase subunit K